MHRRWGNVRERTDFSEGAPTPRDIAGNAGRERPSIDAGGAGTRYLPRKAWKQGIHAKFQDESLAKDRATLEKCCEASLAYRLSRLLC